MTRNNKRLLRNFVRAFVLILALCLMLVGCEEEPKRDFPAVNQNAVGGNPSENNSTKKPNNSSNSNNNSNKDSDKSNNNSNTDLNNNSNNSGKKRVSITYDDGPHVERTVAIVDELAKYGFHATFFVIGNRVDGTKYSGGEAVKYAASKGNEIAIHAYTHDYYYHTCDDSTYKNELGKTHDAILGQLPNAKVKLMRPVGGNITAQRVEKCDYSVIMWNVDSNDWKHKYDGEEGVEKIVDNVMSQVSDGSIILMHDIYENTYLATKEILKQLNNQGYEVVTVRELLGSPQAGVKYSKAP